MLSPESQRKDKSSFFPMMELLIFDKGFLNSKMNDILEYKWDLHIHKVTLRTGLILRKHLTAGLLFVTIFFYRKRI